MGSALAADAASADHWAPLQRFVGDWAGEASGQSGTGTVARSYRWVMRGRYLYETNESRYPPSERKPAGEVHEHWSMFSYDKARKLLMLRQFHVESFINTYAQVGPAEGGDLVFESEQFENFSNSWKARERYEFVSDNEFIETFELAAPGKPYQVYSRNHLRRVSK